MARFDKKKLLYNTKENLKEANRQVITQTTTFISSAFILVAALAWNDLIREIISRYLSAGSGILSRSIYTLTVTLIAVFIASRLTKISQKFKDETKK